MECCDILCPQQTWQYCGRRLCHCRRKTGKRVSMCCLCDKAIITQLYYVFLIKQVPYLIFPHLFSDLFHYKSHGSVSNTAMWNVDAIRGTLRRQRISNQLANLHCSIQRAFTMFYFVLNLNILTMPVDKLSR